MNSAKLTGWLPCRFHVALSECAGQLSPLSTIGRKRLLVNASVTRRLLRSQSVIPARSLPDPIVPGILTAVLTLYNANYIKSGAFRADRYRRCWVRPFYRSVSNCFTGSRLSAWKNFSLSGLIMRRMSYAIGCAFNKRSLPIVIKPQGR